MRRAGEQGMRDPVNPFAAHLNQARRAALHPVGHEVAADAGTRAAAFRHHGAGVVRAAGAEIGQTFDIICGVGKRGRRGEVAHMLEVVAEHGVAREVHAQPMRHQLDQARRPQLAQRADQRCAVTRQLAHDGRAFVCGGVVEQLAQLGLDHRAFLLDHQDLSQALRKSAQPRRFDRKGQARLVDPHTDLVQHGRRDFQAAQHFHEIQMRLAAGDDAHRGLRRFDHQTVDRIHAGKRAHRGQLVSHARLDAQRRQVGPANMQAVWRRHMAAAPRHFLGVGPLRGASLDRIQIHRGGAFHHF